MSVPTVGTVTPNGAASSIVINWSTPSLTGGSAITGYYIQTNNGYGGSFIAPGTLIAVGTNTHTFTSLIQGAQYKFKIAAVNVVYFTNAFTGDELNFSDSITVIAANVPS